MNKELICSLDIGASSVKAMIARPDSLDLKESRNKSTSIGEKILGYSESPTKGFSRGVVTNLSLLSDAIEEAISKAEHMADTKVRKVITNISGVHIRTFKSRGSVHISDTPTEIKERDIDRCIESAKLIAMSLDREVLHLLPERFFIDDKIEIEEPLGLFGSKLDVDLNIVTSLVSILNNITRAINLAGYEVEDIVASSCGTALAVFSEQELDDGAVVIDIGKDLTECALFMQGKLVDCFYFPFGSDDFTLTLQNKLKILFEEAEELRIKHGIVTGVDDAEYNDEVAVPRIKTRHNIEEVMDNATSDKTDLSPTQARTSVVSRREISNILRPRVEELIQEVYKR